MKKQHDNLDPLYQNLANRFEALGQFFGQLGTPKATQELIESLISDDPAPFHQIIDQLNLPLLGKCFWLRELVEHVVSTPVGFVTECFLRDNLTPEERQRFFFLAYRYRQLTRLEEPLGRLLPNGRKGIAPGPFLDELKAAGLVTCQSRPQYEVSSVWSFAPPTKVCV